MLQKSIDIMIAEINVPKELEPYIKITGEEIFVNWKDLDNLKRKV